MAKLRPIILFEISKHQLPNLGTQMSDVTEQKALTENYANAIWAVADLLHGPFNDDEYGEVILPFVLLRRFECV